MERGGALHIQDSEAARLLTDPDERQQMLLEQAEEWVFRSAFDAEKGLLMQVTSPLMRPLSPAAPAAWLSDIGTNLDVETAKALQHECYFNSQPGAGQRYYLVLGLVPIKDPKR